VDWVNPLTGGDAAQAKVVGASPPEHEAVSVTRPPPTGNGDEGEEVIVQPDGGGGGAAATVTVVDPSGSPFGIGPVNE